MGGFILLGMLAAFGLVCAVWVLAGLLLPGYEDGFLVYVGERPREAAEGYLWLREMGLIRGKLVILEHPDCDREWYSGNAIEICSRAELIRRLTVGEKEIDAGT